jgi:hypothetical protein
MIRYLTKLIAILLFSSGTAFAATNPAPSPDEEFQKIVDQIVAKGAEDGCNDPNGGVWL